MMYAKKKKVFVKCTEMTLLGGRGCTSYYCDGISICQFTESNLCFTCLTSQTKWIKIYFTQTIPWTQVEDN